MPKSYTLIQDPLFYIMLAIFALLTTVLPSVVGQPRFLPLAQTVALTLFLIQPIRQRNVTAALLVMVIWLPLQFAALLAVTYWLPVQSEHAMSNGFAYGRSYLQWFYGGGVEPSSFLAQPLNRAIELVGILLGSLLSGGLIGVWFLVRATNLAAYGMGLLLNNNLPVLATLPVWTLLRLCGYAGFVILLAEALLTSQWSLRYYLTARRRLLLIATLLLVLGLVAEFLLPILWGLRR